MIPIIEAMAQELTAWKWSYRRWSELGDSDRADVRRACVRLFGDAIDAITDEQWDDLITIGACQNLKGSIIKAYHEELRAALKALVEETAKEGKA